MSLSLWVFFGLFLILMLFDLWILVTRGYRATVSANLYTFAGKYPIIPFLFGVLVGHLWFPVLSACLP